MIRAALCLMLLPGAGWAEVLSFPGNAEMTAEVVTSDSTAQLPMEPWRAAEGLPTMSRAGTVTTQAWRIAADDLTAAAVMRPLRQQLRDAGFEIVFDCDTIACGGFDFRFAVDVMLPPDMQVDLNDFAHLTALRDDMGIAILTSRSNGAGHAQVTFVSDAADAALSSANAPRLQASDSAAAGLEAALADAGRYVLEGLTFATGSARLEDGPAPALAELADYLAAYPDRTVALVGHTDAEGTLDGNIALSKRRAGAVLERLVSEYQVPRRQLDAQGMGYLSPRASNLTAEGRSLNRRVEVIVTSTTGN